MPATATRFNHHQSLVFQRLLNHLADSSGNSLLYGKQKTWAASALKTSRINGNQDLEMATKPAPCHKYHLPLLRPRPAKSGLPLPLSIPSPTRPPTPTSNTSRLVPVCDGHAGLKPPPLHHYDCRMPNLRPRVHQYHSATIDHNTSPCSQPWRHPHPRSHSATAHVTLQR
jgi:hypothetical protein